MAKASQVVIMEGEYYIIKSPNGKVLEVKDFNTENGAGFQLWSYENAKVCVVNADDALTMPIRGADERCVSFGGNMGD